MLCPVLRGHHAQPDMADGYCFFNNIGIAIENLRNQGLKKAAVIDWDVHHGNGTQEGFYADADILTVSLHMNHGAWGDTHPQTGAVEEVGTGSGAGKNLNLPMPYGSGDKAYLRVFDEVVVPMVRRHQPEILFIAAGQDANQFDPNGRQLLSMSGFYELGDGLVLWQANVVTANCAGSGGWLCHQLRRLLPACHARRRNEPQCQPAGSAGLHAGKMPVISIISSILYGPAIRPPQPQENRFEAHFGSTGCEEC